jgi:hypothetical protein
MVHVADVFCPLCSHRFQVVLAGSEPREGERFEVVCPSNGSRFWFYPVRPVGEDITHHWFANNVRCVTKEQADTEGLPVAVRES